MNIEQIKQVIDDIRINVENRFDEFEGQVASYIPALAEVEPNQFAMSVFATNGDYCQTGDCNKAFTIQSVAKVLTLTLALQRYGDELWQRVGREPSGTAFNSLTQLEFENGIPRNPFINAGAIVTCDALYSRLSAPVHHMVETFRRLSKSGHICVNNKVAKSEFEHRNRNAAMAHLMKSFGNFNNDVEDVLKAYFSFCAIEMTTVELAKSFSYLANKGIDVGSQEQILSSKQNSQLNSIMFTSGLYDASGDFAYRVGMPGKSGVGGAILAVVPNRYTIAVWSPKINKTGNSTAGIYALEEFANKLNIQLF